jgi:hypothetical protein
MSKIEELRSRSARARMAEAGIAAVTERYNWMKDSERLDAALRHVVGISSRRGEKEKDN